jgi:hypothetical protein
MLSTRFFQALDSNQERHLLERLIGLSSVEAGRVEHLIAIGHTNATEHDLYDLDRAIGLVRGLAKSLRPPNSRRGVKKQKPTRKVRRTK